MQFSFPVFFFFPPPPPLLSLPPPPLPPPPPPPPGFQVNLYRKFNFLHSGLTHEGVPIIASNMDTVGTFEMAVALAKVTRPNIFWEVNSSSPKFGS